MKVLYFAREYTPHDHRFLSALSAAGHQAYYLRLERRSHTQEDRALPPQVEIIDWAGGKCPVRFSDGPRLLWSLRQVLKKVRPDVVHAGPIQTCALLCALSGYRPLVAVSWGSDLLVDAGKSAAMGWATRYVMRQAGALVGDCRPVRQAAIAYGMDDETIITFPWGVDLRHFCPAPPVNADDAPAKSTFTLLSTRSWEPIYGVDVIANAFVRAARELPNLHLLMLGGGSLASQLRAIFARGGVEDRVTFTGQVPRARLPEMYRRADLYISASHSDGTSISLLEALACGRPALVSDIPGNREWIQPGVQGWHFPDGDADALARGILEAAADPARLAQMGQAARTLAEARADWEKNFPLLFQAYEIAIQRQGHG